MTKAKATFTQPAEDPRIAKLVAQVNRLNDECDKANEQAEIERATTQAARDLLDQERKDAEQTRHYAISVVSRFADAMIDVATTQPERVTKMHISNYPGGAPISGVSSITLELSGDAS
jgi:hypothetical protein